jgi:S-adenosylhomocysteine hydrolase
MDGFRVVKLEDVLPLLDILVTATGKEWVWLGNGCGWEMGVVGKGVWLGVVA